MTSKLQAQLIVFILLMALVPVTKGEAPTENQDTLRVLVWNVWRGTNKVKNGPEKALKLIKDSKADICLLQESYDVDGPRPQFGIWAAKQLGWNAWQGDSPHLCVISPFKFGKRYFHKPWHALGVELVDPKGRTLHAFSMWIDYKSPIANHLMNNPEASDAELLASETSRSGRLAQSKEILAYLGKHELTSLKTPLLVGGDWNCPSHLDWTEATAERFPYRRHMPELPVSRLMERAGFSDAYRVIHPDPVKYPGDTWSPLFRERDGKALPMDRIDRLYCKSNRQTSRLRPIRATVYPEVLEKNEVPTLERQFPSDHAALLIEFQWQN